MTGKHCEVRETGKSCLEDMEQAVSWKERCQYGKES